MDAEVTENSRAMIPDSFIECFLAALIGVFAGSASALFLWSLDRVTEFRFQHPQTLYGLPLAGVVMVAIYKFFGKSSGRGNNLILDHIHGPGGGVPRRMAPLVLVSTLLSHLCGGSVGREGTAVQMGGSIASSISHFLRVDPKRLPILLTAGVAAGFGSVFGTPLAGAIFAIEVPSRSRVQFAMFLPACIASFTGDFICHLWKITHTAYPHLVMQDLPWSSALLSKVVLVSIAFGLVGKSFASLAHAAQRAYEFIKIWWLRPVLGAILVLSITAILGTPDYLGLSVSNPNPSAITIQTAFHEGGVTFFSWFWKLLLTITTLGAGFKGGEVTPLFFIGATFGNTLAGLLGAPVEMFAALGFVTVFCSAAHTPIAGTFLAMELFGAPCGLLFLLACFIANFACGATQLYSSQRPGKTL